MLVTCLILFLLLLLLAWVGWRFFIASPVQAIECLQQDEQVELAIVADMLHVSQKAESANIVADFSDEKSRSAMPSLLKNVRIPLASFLLVVAVVAVTLKLNALHVIEPFLPQEYGQTAHIQDTLAEAKLEPPPALPPEVFISATISRPGLATADRDWSKLDSSFVQQVLQVMKKMNERGYPLALLEGYRSPERQDNLAQMANLVTKAKGGQSKHQYGWAVDLAPMKNGKVIISEKDEWASEAYQALGEEAEAVGLTWGGRWSFKDYGHIERAGSLAVLLQKNK